MTHVMKKKKQWVIDIEIETTEVLFISVEDIIAYLAEVSDVDIDEQCKEEEENDNGTKKSISKKNKTAPKKAKKTKEESYEKEC